ncbi:PP2C family protein-serine/threonine phosphatase [Kitasatospora sp. NPDC052896]|uniref:PP2C family protein-serine/threonine phosphatase n=1 Tax=Kitasatospora sp. NPDC052896 TaxID=3364061 RepID=UPI0037C64258
MSAPVEAGRPPAAPHRGPSARRDSAASAVVAGGAHSPRWVRWLPALLIVLDLSVEAAVPRTTAAGFMLIILPVVVAFGYGPVPTAASSTVALGLQLLLAARVGHLYEQHHVWAYVSTSLAGLAGVMLARQRLRQARHLVRARTVSEALQRTVLHPVPEQVGGLRAAGLYRAAQAEVAIGGDLYEICDTAYGTRVLLGDVRGKGLEAIRTVADVLGAFRVTAHETADLAELAEQLDRQVRRGALERDDEELFVTALLVEHDPAAREARLISRGHPDPVLLGDGTVRTLHCPQDLPLGLGHLRPPHSTAVSAVPLDAGQTLLLHTDGVTEARDRAGHFYPLTERLAARFSDSTAAPEQLVAFLDEDVHAYGGPATDDLAVLALTPTR